MWLTVPPAPFQPALGSRAFSGACVFQVWASSAHRLRLTGRPSHWGVAWS